MHRKVFYIQIWFKLETPLLFFSNKNHGLQKKKFFIYKKAFSGDYVKITELHGHTWRHMQSE